MCAELGVQEGGEATLQLAHSTSRSISVPLQADQSTLETSTFTEQAQVIQARLALAAAARAAATRGSASRTAAADALAYRRAQPRGVFLSCTL